MSGSRTEAEFEQECRVTFNIFDEDNSGNIDSREFGKLMRALGFNPTEKQLAAHLLEVDTDKSGFIEYDEFKNFIKKEEAKRPGHMELRSALIAAFKLFDLDQNGFLSSDELKTIMKTMGEVFTDEDCKILVQEADTDNDGHVDYTEFVDRMLKE